MWVITRGGWILRQRRIAFVLNTRLKVLACVLKYPVHSVKDPVWFGLLDPERGFISSGKYERSLSCDNYFSKYLYYFIAFRDFRNQCM